VGIDITQLWTKLKRQRESPVPDNKELVVADTFWVPHQETHAFAEMRYGNKCEALVDGMDAMAKMADAMNKAGSFIYITDWWINAYLFLVRKPLPFDPENRLIEILRAKAKSAPPVRVRILLWESGPHLVINNRDEEAEKAFESDKALDIKVSRHPAGHQYWSHHQKGVVVDGKVAFVGGVDMCKGRWDNSEHNLNADESIFYNEKADAGKDKDKPHIYYMNDFYSPSVAEVQDKFDTSTTPPRDRFPRMPWHDIHVRIEGPAAHDVERNFVERWKFQGKKGTLNESAPPDAGAGKQMVQIVRSIGKTTLGAETENSIQHAYLQAIQNAQHYVYIENQFFTSHYGDDAVKNEVADAIFNRVKMAIDHKEVFRVIVVMPVHPEGLVSGHTLDVMHFQFMTIRAAGSSLVERIKKEVGDDKVADYIGFFNLRNYALLKVMDGKDRLVTEQVYVHAKLMIVDDRVAIIGSANINDRSLAGDRDSEISSIIVDKDVLVSQMNGKKVWVRRFAHELRMRLWQEHLGIAGRDLGDPVCDDVYKGVWWKTANDNSKLFNDVFPDLPRDEFPTLKDQQNARRDADPSRLKDLQDPKNGVKGHLTLFPLQWLQSSDTQRKKGWFDSIYT
jgi:phospholipase D1/2